MQSGYAMQWGPKGRDDLGMMKNLGGNAVRLYHSIGTESAHPHGPFLDRAAEVGIHVLPGFHSYMSCDQNDCFNAWKAAAKSAFAAGFQKGSEYHPAISMLILLNEPDFTPCSPDKSGNKAWCRVQKALSAMDGVLQAEKEAGINAGSVGLTITWSFGIATSVDGKVSGPGIFGFQDMVAGTSNPSLAHYTPKTPLKDLQQAFQTRWVHSLNTQAPWSYVKDVVDKVYSQFLPNKWFIGEYGANGVSQTEIENDLKAMDEAASGTSGFIGVNVFQFQTAYAKGGSEMNFGIFSLGDSVVGQTDDVCEGSTCKKWTVHCLDTTLPIYPGQPDKNHRAEAVARGWGGSANGHGRCDSSTALLEYTSELVV